MDLVPPVLVVARYFASEQAAIDALQAKQDAAEHELEEFVEEHGGEEGLLAEALNDKGNVTKSGREGPAQGTRGPSGERRRARRPHPLPCDD